MKLRIPNINKSDCLYTPKLLATNCGTHLLAKNVCYLKISTYFLCVSFVQINSEQFRFIKIKINNLKKHILLTKFVMPGTSFE